ncbi:MAG TPA: VCBS repeat-containing protein, partial [Bacteroidota bacterium]|nr:VCBS repeat-containing protein [Bacteroidota bacterium]
MNCIRFAPGFSGLLIPILFLGEISPLLQAQTAVSFTHSTIDASGPLDPWGKAAGDINGDGKIDIIVGGYTSGGLVWYENPGWVKHTVSGRAGFRTDHEVRDIDRDGRNDIVSLGADANGSPVIEWFRNPGASGTWTATVISQQTLHDVEVADLDGNGDLDCVARDQEVFGSGRGDIIYVYIQKTPSSWTPFTFSCTNGEGLKVADINRDGKPDIIISGTWFENLGNGTAWKAHSYTTDYTHTSVTVDVADINGDGRADIVLAPAETIGGTYRISWF